MNKLKMKLYEWMRGRYGGNDSLGKFLLWGYLAVLFVAMFTGLEWLMFVGAGMFVWSIYRTFSRKIAARQKENAAFLKLKNKLTFRIKAIFDRKHAYRVCPKCGACLRLPRKKGKRIAVCPKCRGEFTVKI